MQEKLKQNLFDTNMQVYAVLDGASVLDLPTRIYEMRPPAVCLYRGELEPDIAEVAPYLVELKPEMTFTNWLFAECAGKHWGIFARSALSLIGMRKHFRRFLTVYDENGNPLLFRYYDPRVLTKFLPTCEETELSDLFSRVASYFAESGAAELLRFEMRENGKLHSTVV